MDPRLSNITHVFLDADDTLWENDVYYRKAESEFVEFMRTWCDDAEAVAETLAIHQEKNIAIFGYGSKTYLLGMLDAATELIPGGLTSEYYDAIKAIIVRLETHPFDFLNGAEDVVRSLARKYTVVIATKGELSEQMRKYRISGLSDCVTAIEVMEKKSIEDYRNLAVKMGVAPENFFMVGNAVRSDIAPVIAMGGWAVHCPYEITWAHEIAPMPESDRVFEIRNLRELKEILL